MATAKILQTPKIIELQSGKIRVAHPDIRGNIADALAGTIAAAGTTMTLYDNNGLADNDWLLVGNPGDRETETCDVNGAVTRGQTITVTNNLDFAHGLDTPVTKIFERGIKIYGAATDGGAGTLIASIDAITASGKQLADAVMIQWDKENTEFTLITSDTSYAYYYATFTDGVTESSASTYVPSTGLAYSKLENLVDQALSISNTKIDGARLTREMLVDWSNDCLDEIKQFVYQDPGSGRWMQKDWSFEIVLDTTIPLVRGEDAYLLSGLGSTIKYPNSDKSIFSVQIGDERPMLKYAIKDYDILRRGIHKTYTDGTTAVGAVTMDVDSTANFASSGSIRIGTQTITYTGVTSTSFTGIPASGTGSVTAEIADNTAVWQNMTEGKPGRWVIFNGSILLDRPPDATWAGQTLKVRFLKSLSRFTSVSDAVEVPFTNVFTIYLVAMIFFRMGKTENGERWMAKFKKQVTNNAVADYIPPTDELRYYNYSDGVYDEGSPMTTSQYYFND